MYKIYNIYFTNLGRIPSAKIRAYEDSENQMPRLLLQKSENRRAVFRKPVSFTESSHVWVSPSYIPHYLIIPQIIFCGLTSFINKAQITNVKGDLLPFPFLKTADFLLEEAILHGV